MPLELCGESLLELRAQRACSVAESTKRLFGSIRLLAGDVILAGVIRFDGAGEGGYGLRKMWGRGTAQKIS